MARELRRAERTWSLWLENSPSFEFKSNIPINLCDFPRPYDKMVSLTGVEHNLKVQTHQDARFIFTNQFK